VTPRKTAPKSTFVAQDWQKVAESSDAAADLEWAHAEGAEDEEWECIACNKTFRSEAAWNSHERSKKHLRAVEQLKREMQDEEQELGLGQTQDDEVADVDVKVKVHLSDTDQGPAGANAIAGDRDSPKATPDRGASAATPKEEGNAIEDKDFSSRPGSRQKRAKERARTPSPSPTLPIPKLPQKGRARATGSASPLQQPDGDLEFSEENPNHAESEGDVVPEDDGGGAANPAKGEPLSKREKRRAREAAKKVRGSEAKSACSVSSLALILSHSIRALPLGTAPVSRICFQGGSVPVWLFDLRLIVSNDSATFAGRRLKAGPNCSNMSIARAIHWQIHVMEMRQRIRERRRSSRGDMMD
jgi:DnaJ family protein A protein 5